MLLCTIESTKKQKIQLMLKSNSDQERLGGLKIESLQKRSKYKEFI
jgi:hypothetical protein